MHLLDHHGLTSVIGFCILHKVVRECDALGSNQEGRLSKLNDEMQAYQDGHIVSPRMPRLKMSNLVTNKWSELSGPLVKAANARHLSPFIEIVARKHLDGTKPEHNRIIRLASHLNAIYHVLYNACLFLTIAEENFLRTNLFQLGKYHMLCRADAEAAGSLSFQVRPKAHYVQHLWLQSLLVNSRYTQNYCFESVVGKVTQIWEKSCAGQYQKTVQRVVCVKYLVYLAIIMDL